MDDQDLKQLQKSNPSVPDLKGFIESKVRMNEFKHFNLEVGVDGIQFIGLPGSGKTSFAQLICKDLMKELGENILMSGDRFCEFRHFFRYPRIVQKITLFLPDNQELYFHNIPTEQELNNRYNAKGLVYEVIKINLDEFNINKYLTNETKANLFVIYDNHYQGKYLWKRAELWKRITKQLLERTVLLDCAITTLYNEAGILWQEGASGKHWQEINDYSEIIVECRKGLVRVILLAQLETEIYHPIRKKMLWKCYRLGTTSKFAPKSVRSSAPFQSRSAYILMYGGMYLIGNQTPKFTELKETWKIIPIGEPVIEEDENIQEGKYPIMLKAQLMKEHNYHNKSLSLLSRDYGISRTTLTSWSKDVNILELVEKIVG